MAHPLDPIRRAIAGQVRATFADEDGRGVTIDRADTGLFGPGSAIWRVHGDVTTMMIGGTAALLMQMLHPVALLGVWEHSRFRNDMRGRLRRTSAFIAETTYGSRAQAEAAIGQVRAIHAKVRGRTPQGSEYRADDPALLAWVHAAEAWCFLESFRRYRDPLMSGTRQDRYLAEIGVIARALGADPVPVSRTALSRVIDGFRPQLAHDARTAAAARALLGQKPPAPLYAPVQALTFSAAIAMLPGWARRMHGFGVPVSARPLLTAGAAAMAATTRWAMRPA
jgi:uncharacterized protein (DUF2236 family)